jgi:4-amino-4-deoxy-L-arabinose transferase-like glycosyltransferase
LKVVLTFRNVLFGMVLIGFTVALFYKLGDAPLEPYDDATYADIAQHIVGSGDWLNLRWLGGATFLEKPPVYFWIAAALFRTLGVNELAARLFPAGCAVVLIGLIYLFATVNAPRMGFIAPLLVLTIAEFWEYSGRAMLDIPVTLFVSSALIAFWIAQETSTRCLYYWLYGMATALAILTKSVVGLIPILVTALYFLLTHPKRLLDREYLTGTGVAIALSAPWHIWMSHRYGSLFWREYVGYHVFQRFTGDIAGNVLPPWFYASYFLHRQPLFFFAAIIAMAVALHRAFRARDQFAAFLLIWSGLVFTIFSASQGKLFWYILPMFPPAVVLVSYVAEQSTKTTPLHGSTYIWILMIGIAAILAWDVGLAGFRFHRDRIERSKDEYQGSQLRRLSQQLREKTRPGERISIFHFGAAVSLVGYYADRPVRFLFDNPATEEMYAKIPTNYEAQDIVRFLPGGIGAAIELMRRDSGVLLLEKMIVGSLPPDGMVIAETRDLLAVQFGPR